MRTLPAMVLLLIAMALGGGAMAGPGPLSLADDLRAGSVLVDRTARQFYLYPPGPGPGHPKPLVIVLHGGSRAGDALRVRTGANLEALAHREGFLLAYPNGILNVWNDGRDTPFIREQGRFLAVDVAFISALIDSLVEAGLADRRRVYVVGISNGGFMAFRLACEIGHRITAIAAIAAAMPENLPANCHPTRPIPVLMINGTEDRLVPWGGGPVAGTFQDRGTVLSVPASTDYWRKANGCAGEALVQDLEDRAPGDGTTVRRHHWSNCKGGSSIRLYEIVGGGHVWPNVDLSDASPVAQRVLGRSTFDIDGPSTIWSFFKNAPPLP